MFHPKLSPQRTQRGLRALLLAAPMLALSACGNAGSAEPTETETAQAEAVQTARADTASNDGRYGARSDCMNCGTITAIQAREVEGEPSAAATVAGAIIGGVIGHQFGSGSGKDAATAAGAIGGAAAGREIDKNAKSYTVYDVTIDMDDGPRERVTVGSVAGYDEGDRVRVSGEKLVAI